MAGNTGARDDDYSKYDNDAVRVSCTSSYIRTRLPCSLFSAAHTHGHSPTRSQDNYDPTLNSSSAEYFRNIDTDDYAEMTVDRWKSGGGIQVGDSDKPGGLGIFAQGKTRDDDGTIDRVRDPPKELLPLLYKLRRMAEAYNIALEEAFVAAGGTQYGTIPTSKFCSCLVITMHRAGLTEVELSGLVEAYGIGNREPARHAKSRVVPFECCAWKDLIEDIEKAIDPYANATRLPTSAAAMYPRGVKSS